MGLTYVSLRLRKSKETTESVEQELLVDSGAVFSVVPGRILRQLGVVADAKETFTLANGEQLVRWTGDAYFEYQGKGGYSKVVFGEEGDMNLLGVLTLEACGWVLDPLKRLLRPLPMLLA
jgi:predicted aspartyl protease